MGAGWWEGCNGAFKRAIVFFLQIDTLSPKCSKHDKHLQDRLFQALALSVQNIELSRKCGPATVQHPCGGRSALAGLGALQYRERIGP